MLQSIKLVKAFRLQSKRFIILIKVMEYCSSTKVRAEESDSLYSFFGSRKGWRVKTSLVAAKCVKHLLIKCKLGLLSSNAVQNHQLVSMKIKRDFI